MKLFFEWFSNTILIENNLAKLLKSKVNFSNPSQRKVISPIVFLTLNFCVVQLFSYFFRVYWIASVTVAYCFPWWLFISSRIEMRCCNIFWMSRVETSKLFTHLVHTVFENLTKMSHLNFKIKNSISSDFQIFEFSRQN